MTPQEILTTLDKATDPRHVGQLTRQDYVNINTAINDLKRVLEEYIVLKARASVPPPPPPAPAPYPDPDPLEIT